MILKPFNYLKAKLLIGSIGYYCLAFSLAFVVCIPFFWMLSTSLKSQQLLLTIPIEWFPKHPTLDAFKQLFMIPNFVRSIFNSFYLATLTTVTNLLFASMAAFALTKIPFKGQKNLFILYIAALMIPVQITFIPIFVILTKLNLTNNLNTFIFFTLFNPFAIFMLRQRMLTIHNAFIEAALIDGASYGRIFFQIMLPLCKGTLATLALLSFMGSWNDYLMPLVLLTDHFKATLPIILSSLNGQYGNQYNLMMAGAIISIIPILTLYTVLSAYYKEGLTLGGVK